MKKTPARPTRRHAPPMRAKAPDVEPPRHQPTVAAEPEPEPMPAMAQEADRPTGWWGRLVH